MALPEQVLDKLTREPASTPGWSGRLLTISLVVFGVSIASYLGIRYAWQPYLASQIEKLKAEVESAGLSIPLGDQQKLAAFYSELANIKTLLGKHIFLSPVFSWLEKNTSQNIYFLKLTLDTTNRQMVLTGAGRKPQDVADQIAALQNQPEVKQATLRTMNADEAGLWQFDLVLSLDPTFLRGVIANAANAGK